MLVPVVGGLVLSLTNYDGFIEIEFVGLIILRDYSKMNIFILRLKQHLLYDSECNIHIS